MDGNTGNVYPKHKQRNNSDNKIQTNSKKSVNQFKKNTCNTKQVGKKRRRRRNKKKKKFKKTKSINQSINK